VGKEGGIPSEALNYAPWCRIEKQTKKISQKSPHMEGVVKGINFFIPYLYFRKQMTLQPHFM